MYSQYLQVMYATSDGWMTLRDDEGKKARIHNMAYGNVVRANLQKQEGVLDTMLVKVEETEVYNFATRAKMTHTIYTGLTDA